MKEIYLDHAATTYVREEVRQAMDKYFSEEFGNPGSFHTTGLRAKEALNQARQTVAKLINASKQEEIIFTGSGTESINLAIKGIARANKNKGKHIITTKIEHEAVLETCNYLEKYEGFEITYLNVDRYGRVCSDELRKAIREDTILITIMYANNEIGTIQPIKELAKIAKEHNIYFHTDACQAGGALDINVKNFNIDLMTLNSSKIYGPKGVGILYIKSGIKIHPIIHGGGQEFKLRSGTENVPSIIGFAKALELAQTEKEKENKRLITLRDKLIKKIQEKIPKTILNGHPTERLPNNVNITFLDIEGEAMMLYLNEYGICTSSGSACTSQSLDPSHVILALGLPYEVAHGTLRFTLGKQTQEKDIDKVLKVLPEIVESLRKISPVRLKVEEVLN
ncbi:MAG: cysteine desulfurase NifS [Nanoarchaeota archaeon]|nr:cysteine desulfurase NifS [Nanoarchaeota archaeon]MBU1632069.1 cysteine desulfurase NifS [Nanoarchaeota archaeon]MBU1875703.1 cysteine desulfurase NifS [Nanoarchaeota archaeon]